MKPKPLSQKARIIRWLSKGHKLNQMDALCWFGCSRLASRIRELRKEGYEVETKMVDVEGKTFASYRLPKT